MCGGIAIIIDSHQHFWRYNADQFPWITPEQSALKRDVLPHDLEPVLQANGIEGTILVQARAGLDETEWLLALAAQTSFVKGVIGLADPRDPQIFAQLERLTADSKLAGLCYNLAGQPPDVMLSPAFLAGLDVLHNYDLVFDFLIEPEHLPAVLQIARRFPRQRFVIDHLARPRIGQEIESWADGIQRLAPARNVYCKLSGVTQASGAVWQSDDLQPYLDIAFETFGAARLMFGSDWPVCTLAAPYERVLSLLTDYIQRCSRAEQKLIMNENARQVYFYYKMH